MIKNVLVHITDIDVYPVVSLLVFVTFFAGLLLWVARMKKGHLDHMSQLPLNDRNESAGESSHV